jgi:hypothetical protein
VNVERHASQVVVTNYGRRMIVISDKYGQLGNRLFVFAHFIGWGIEHSSVIANPAFDEYAQYFEGTADDPWCRYPPRPSPSRHIARARHRNYNAVRLASQIGSRLRLRTPLIGCENIGGDELCQLGDKEHAPALLGRKLTLVRGWQYRDEASLQKHAAAIRAYFTPRAPHLRTTEAVVAAARATCDVLVGVHIRRGDYINFMDGRYYYEQSVYRELMDKVRRRRLKGREIGFLVCSDEPVDAAFYRGLNVHRGPDHPIEDMYAFTRCDNLIGPPSTYTMWASYYGNVPLLQITSATDDPVLTGFPTG